MSLTIEEALLLFLALVGLYSPAAGVSPYLPLLKPFSRRTSFASPSGCSSM